MLKSATLLGSVFCTGLLLGLALATWGRSAPVSESRDPQSAPSAVTAVPATDQPPVASPAKTTSAPQVEALQARILQLTQQVETASAARQQLQDELGLVKETIQSLEERLDELTETEDEPQRPVAARSRLNDAETLIAAGFDPDDAEYLVDRWGQQQMDLLYLRDQAIREGWLDTPRYEQAVRDLRGGDGSIRDELGPDAYDRFLFATGRANRVVLNSIIDSSPAQVIGLQPGDTILSYDGSRIFSFRDLRAATTTGDPGAPVVIEIVRDGQRLELEIDRGPIGVTLGSRRDEPSP
ncbi:PDZ domain-containing protein [Candidatus Entotheonella palauensis]|uniref:PDZ domain-containing protein n=1 Tax=Candidatus Entotheonella palauensis TaxID=93172 RepID=UPI000B7D209C|nr:PDZ domain-containing protein [Candidatus Entotheonella palauensis]